MKTSLYYIDTDDQFDTLYELISIEELKTIKFDLVEDQ